MPSKLPQSIVPTTPNDTNIFRTELLNADLSKKQKSTLIHLIDIHPQIFPSTLQKCLSIRLNVDTLKPYAQYRLHNKHRKSLSTHYDSVEIIVPLDTPPKSTVTLIGVQRPYHTPNTLIQDVDNVDMAFNATKIESWHTIMDKLRPMLVHNIDTHRMYTQYYDAFR